MAARDLVRLLDADPELGDGLAVDERDRARHQLVAEVLRVGPGRWDAAGAVDPGTSPLGLLILDGLLLRDLDLGRRASTEVLGTGDILRPWDADAATGELPFAARWMVLEPLRLAILDQRFLATSLRYPSIVDALFARATRRNRGLATRLVINQLVRLEDRLLLALWTLADRWGRVTPDGVLIPMGLTHSALARLVGARRPSVTSALGDLGRERLLERTEDGWLLRGDPAHLVDPVTERLLSPA
ncbi:helix-turn-helix domain-containing protein [Baekduia sp. Peel2402]|uniref:helix-turn-helix domain-containing protein n=1 Tax=Baekduia sp. Peel2402 TaxID=3458296 RepID=UPI00403E6CAD